MKDLIIQNIPQEIYAIALDYMGQDRAEDGDHSGLYHEIVDQRGWTASELEQAISDCLLFRGEFSEGGEFEDAIIGWRIHK